MFERIMKYNKVARMLQIQYRMHEDIADWASKAMYHGRLISHETVKSRKLYDLANLPKVESPKLESADSLVSITRDATLLLIDTAGSEMFESVNAAGSRYNEGEAQIVELHVRNLLQIGLKQEEIAVITPYNGQVEIMKRLLLGEFPRLEIRSVDGFQGGEREAVVLSLVRSSDRNGADGIGFLKDKRRLNVAVTRAKRQCAVICDSDTVNQDNFLKGLVTWIESKGEYLSAIEYCSSEPIHQKSIADFPDINNNVDQLKPNSTKSEVAPKRVAPTKQQKVKEIPILQKQFKDETNPEIVVHQGRKACINETKNKPSTQGHQHEEIMITEEFDTQLSLNDERNSDSTNKSKDEEKMPESFVETDNPEEDKNNKMNLLLGKLTQERQDRSMLTKPIPNSTKTKKKAPKGGKKLGGSNPKVSKEAEDDLTHLDDMAFLDAQIEKVQNSHGRTIEGSKNYRTIVNGVLIGKPTQPDKKRDPNKTAALQAKLKQAASSRKAKKK